MSVHDVLVVGGGPAGAAAASWLARRGHDVVVVERRSYPRDKACGDLLTPRAAGLLAELGLSNLLAEGHAVSGLRARTAERSVEVTWPSHLDLPAHGLVLRRRELDHRIAEHARACGAVVHESHEAVRPVVERGFVRGAVVQHVGRPDPIELRARYLLVADGANSRFGRSLGTLRTTDWPNAAAIRGYWQSPRHAEAYVETSLELTDHQGNLLPGYGWVIPVGDGTVNVGIGLLSTFREFRSINATHLLQQHLERIGPDWGIEPGRPLGRAVSGRVPVGGSISPKAGPTYLVVGDAAGSVNPFSGTGIGEAFRTAALAADVLHQALATNDPTVLQQYPARYEDELGQYFHVGRLMARAIGRPTVMRQLARASVSSQSVLEWLVRIMTDALRPDDHGAAEAAYATAAALARLAPGT